MKKACLPALLVLLVLAVLVAAGVLICPKCGYEYQAGTALCGHCGAELPAAPPSKPEPDDLPPARGGEAPVLSLEQDIVNSGIVERELRSAEHSLEQNRFWLAMMLGRNAMALNELTSDSRGGRYQRILRVVETCKSKLRVAIRPCPICDGTGKQTILTLSLNAETEKRRVNMPCPACHGRGSIKAATLLKDLRFGRARAIDDYVVLQKRKVFSELFGVWLPADVIPRLSTRQTVAMKRAFGGGCPECLGFGLSGCSSCDGTGLQICSEPSCVAGRAVCPVCKGTGTEKRRNDDKKSSIVRKRRCPKCSGRGLITCETCRGRGFTPCAVCEGRKGIMCRKCEGRGLRPLCGKCDGKAYLECAKCMGTGAYRGNTCPKCNGEGITICTSCRGTGRKR